MSCPDRHSLQRALAAGAASAEGHDVFRHLEGCERCSRAAHALEPTLLFRRLPRLEMNAGEIADMKLAVRAMRKVEALEPLAARSRRHPHAFWHAAAIATVLCSAALLGGSSRPPEAFAVAHRLAAQDVGRLAVASPATADAAAAPFAAGEGLPALAAFEPAQIPLIEDVDPSLGAPIQLVSGDLSVVLFVQSGARPDV